MSGYIEEYALTDNERDAGLGSLLLDARVDFHASPVETKERKSRLEKEKKEKKESLTLLDNSNPSSGYHDEIVALNFFWHAKKIKSEQTIKKEAERKHAIIKLIAGLDNPVAIKEKTIKKLLLNNLDYMIFTYAKKESLPYDYIYLSKQEHCIGILIKGILKKNAYILDATIVLEIDALEQSIYNNTSKMIVYDRVAIVQRFIHNKIDEKHGKKAFLDLPSTAMKNILSAVRLHLNLQDIKSVKAKSLINIIKESERASSYEQKHPYKVILPDLNLSFVNYKRIRDMKSLVDFAHYNIAKKIYDISELSEDIPRKNFIEEVISIYTALNYRSSQSKIPWI